MLLVNWDYCPAVREEGGDGAGHGPVQQLPSIWTWPPCLCAMLKTATRFLLQFFTTLQDILPLTLQFVLFEKLIQIFPGIRGVFWPKVSILKTCQTLKVLVNSCEVLLSMLNCTWAFASFLLPSKSLNLNILIKCLWNVICKCYFLKPKKETLLPLTASCGFCYP